MNPERKAQPTVNVTIRKNPWKYIYYFCMICGKFPMLPIQTAPAGHRYCKSCFLANTGPDEGWRCFCCYFDIKEDKKMGAFFYDKGAKLDIDKLPAKCMTCGFEASMEVMEDHVHISG